MTKTQLQAALALAEAKAVSLAAENDRLRHALEIALADKRLWANGARPAQVVQRQGFQRTPEQEAARALAMQSGKSVLVGGAA